MSESVIYTRLLPKSPRWRAIHKQVPFRDGLFIIYTVKRNIIIQHQTHKVVQKNVVQQQLNLSTAGHTSSWIGRHADPYLAYDDGFGI